MKATHWVICAAILSSLNSFSSEIDSFTLREKVSLKDGLEEMNRLTNLGMDLAIKMSNRGKAQENEVKNEEMMTYDVVPGGCNALKLRKNIFNTLAKGALWSKIEMKANHLGEDYAVRVSRTESIYKSLTFFESIPLFTYGLGKTLEINGVSVGSDKFGHFFHEGWSYFERVNKGENLKVAFDFGDMTEKTYYGLAATGVYSYGDLVANFNGLRFWSALVEGDQITDPVGAEIAPYVRCQDGEWVKTRDFDWNEYVDFGWDEAVNCSTYLPEKEEEIKAEISQRVGEMAKAQNVACPLVPSYCQELQTKYGAEISAAILHPNCRQ